MMITSTAERRRMQRTRVSKAAMIVSKSCAVDCQVRDLTALGAGLETIKATALPTAFQLTLDHGRTYRECRLIWQRSNKLGVAFQLRADARPADH